MRTSEIAKLVKACPKRAVFDFGRIRLLQVPAAPLRARVFVKLLIRFNNSNIILSKHYLGMIMMNDSGI